MIPEPLQVLVIEDSPNDAELIIYELTRAGYSVDWKRVATQGDYTAALNPQIDLILADYNLPQFNALQALHLLQETPFDIPFIVVTGSIEEVAIDCMKQGAADYLLKDRLGRLSQAVERALEQRRLREEKRCADAALQRHNAELEALYKTSLEINAQPDVPSLLETIVARSVDLLDAPIGGLYLMRPDDQTLELVVNHNLPGNYLGTVLRLGEGLSGWVAENGKMLMVEDYHHWEGQDPVYGKDAFCRILAIPLKLGERILGVINIADDQVTGGFTEEQVRLAELFADQAAIAVENARLLDISQRELSERQRAEKALRESQRALATLMSNLPGMAYRCAYQPVWMMKFVSDGCLALTGYQPYELIENQRISYENLIHPDDVSEVRREIEVALKADRPYQINYRIITATGTLRWVWEQGRGIFASDEAENKVQSDISFLKLPEDFDPSATAAFSVSRLFPPASSSSSKKLQALEGFITDITSRVETEEALRNSEELFRQLAETVHDIFWVFEANTGKLIYISPVYETITGRSRWPLYQAPLRLLRAIYPKDLKRVRQAINRYARGLSVHGQYRIVRPDESIRWVEVRTYPIYNDSQQVYRWVGVAEDITESKVAEEQLRQQAKRLQVLDALSRSLADILQDYHAALDAVVHQVVAFLGDGCGIFLLAEDDTLDAVAVNHINPDGGEFLRQITANLSLRQTLSEELLKDGSPVFLTDVNMEELRASIPPAYMAYFEHFGLSSLMAVALRAQGRVIGTVIVLRDGDKPVYTADDLSFLQELANRTALTIINSRLYAENLRRLERLQALREIDTTISGSIDLQISLKVILEKAVTQLGIDAARIQTFDAYMQTLGQMVGQGFRTRNIEQANTPLGHNLAGRAALENRAISVLDWTVVPEMTDGDPELVALLRAEGFVAYFARPLIAKGSVQGVLEVFHRSAFKPEREWFDFLDSLAGQAAIAINNADLFMNLRRTNTELSLAYNETIQGWSRALDLRDHETEGHTQRVAEMTERLARAMGISGEHLAHIRRGALLHDIGKMGVRDQILLKPGKLTEDEWVEMRKHPVYAYNMLAPIAYLRAAIDIPYCHHEWWDGNGYPRGLKDEEIPLEARIFAIADVWDAIVYPRVYHTKSVSEEEAIETIRSLSGVQFDPAIVKKFLEVFWGETGLSGK